MAACDSINAHISFLMMVFFLFSFAEELPTTAFGVILTRNLNVSPSTQTWYYSSAFTAFSLQPIFAITAQFLSDSLGCCRLKYFAIFGVMIGGSMYLLISLQQPSFEYLFAFTITLNIGLSLCTAIIDGISVQISNHFKAQSNVKTLHSAAGIQSISYFFRSFGSLSSSAMLIGLNRISNYGVIALSGSIYLFIVLPFLSCLFPKFDTLRHRHEKFKICKAEVLAIWKCLCFIFLLNIPPTITDVFYSFIYSRTYFDNETLRIFKFMSLTGAVLGALFFFIVLAKKCQNTRCLVLIFVLMQILN